MSVVNPYNGSVFLSPSLPVGYGTTISNPSTQLSEMRNAGTYFKEIGSETDVVLINCELFLISCYKSLSLQKLQQSFVCRMTNIGGINRIRFCHRSLAISFTFQETLKCVGEQVTVAEFDGTNLATINQQLAPLFCQVGYFG